MRKGQLLWTTIALIPALLILAWSMLMFQDELKNYVEMNARFQSLELSSVINILQASPENTIHTYKPIYCAKLVNSEKRSYVEITDFPTTIELIKTPVEIEPGRIGCEYGEESIAREDKIRIKR